MPNKPTSLYDQVVKITRVYLGPAAERFIARQVESHANKKPQKLNQADLKDLIYWIHGAVSLLTEDEGIVEEYISELQKLAGIDQPEGDK